MARKGAAAFTYDIEEDSGLRPRGAVEMTGNRVFGGIDASMGDQILRQPSDQESMLGA